jgi:hypothetical protein
LQVTDSRGGVFLGDVKGSAFGREFGADFGEVGMVLGSGGGVLVDLGPCLVQVVFEVGDPGGRRASFGAGSCCRRGCPKDQLVAFCPQFIVPRDGSPQVGFQLAGAGFGVLRAGGQRGGFPNIQPTGMSVDRFAPGMRYLCRPGRFIRFDRCRCRERDCCPVDREPITHNTDIPYYVLYANP